MGNSTRPVRRDEILGVVGITIRPEGKGVLAEMTVDGAAKLVQSLQRRSAENTSRSVADYFIEELIYVGKRARRKNSAELP